MSQTITEIERQIETIQLLILTVNDKKRVTWHESVIDNEHMNKKKSNKCCIFHKKQDICDSSSEETSDSDSDSDYEND